MKIGVSTASLYPVPLEEAIPRIAALGLRTIEVFFNTYSEFSQPFVGELEKLLREYQMDIVSVHPFTSMMEGILLFTDYARRTEDGFEQYRRYFSAAATLGAKYLTLHGERRIQGAKEDPPAMTERKLERYRRLCRIAEEEGILVAQENVAWCKSGEPAYLKMLMENVPELRYTLDIKQAHRAGHSWFEYFQIMAPRLVNVHINDFDDAHSCLLPGEGIFDYMEFFRALRDVGYDRQALIEVYSSNYSDEQQIADAAIFLHKKAKDSGFSEKA